MAFFVFKHIENLSETVILIKCNTWGRWLTVNKILRQDSGKQLKMENGKWRILRAEEQ
jgi:hypothetical protein